MPKTGESKPWSSDDNKIAWMEVFVLLQEKHTNGQLCSIFGVREDYLKKWLTRHRVPSTPTEPLFKNLGIDTSKLIFSTSTKRATSPAPEPEPAPTATTLTVKTFRPIVEPTKHEPKLNMKDMFELASMMMPLRDQQEVVIGTIEKLLSFSALVTTSSGRHASRATSSTGTSTSRRSATPDLRSESSEPSSTRRRSA
jgi:hypothetical protein